MQQKKKKMHSRKLHRTIVENYLCVLQRLLPVSGCTQYNWRGQGWKRTYLTISGQVHGCKKAPFLQDEKTQFCDFSQKVAYFTLFFTFSRKLSILHLESQCEIGDSLI